MNAFINMEVRFFLMSVAWGAILLVMYDCLRIFRKVVNHGAVLISVEDIIYWAISAVLIFRMMYELNNGIIRGFSLIGILLGMIIYKYSISEYVVKAISFVLIKIKRFIKKVIHILLKPLKFIAAKIQKLLLFLAKKVKKRVGLMNHFFKNKAYAFWKALQSRAKRGRMNESDHTKVKQKKSHNERSNKTKVSGNRKTGKVEPGSMGRRRRKYKRRNGTGLILILVLTIFGTVSYARAKLDDRRAELLVRQSEVQQQLADEQERSSQIEDLSAYVQTKKYIEETAREKLGLVYEDDVLFQSEE